MINESKKNRWMILFMVSFIMMMGYVFWDIVSPLSTTLKAPMEEGGMGWTSAEYGFFAGSYSIFNIFLLMLFFGGIILDKMGIRFTGILATGLMFGGAALNWYAVAFISPLITVEPSFTLFGMIPETVKVQVLVSAVGFGLFGVGCDITGITISKIVTKWFKGYELASAMGVQVAMARLGTASAISFSPLIANSFGVPASLLVGGVLLLIGLLTFFIYIVYDRRFDKEQMQENIRIEKKDDSSFSMNDFLQTLRNPGFWLIAFLCVFFYSSIRPFLKFASDLMVNKYGIQEITAGWIVSILPYGTIILTPLFGHLYDRIGKGATLMLIGCVIVTGSHFLLALPFFHSTFFACIIMCFLGIAFSLVPSAMWSSIPKIVPLKQLGTAYSIIYFVQNIGLMIVPVYIGKIIDDYTVNNVTDFTVPMIVFTFLGIASIILAFALKMIDKRKHYGLEQKNITQR